VRLRNEEKSGAVSGTSFCTVDGVELSSENILIMFVVSVDVEVPDEAVVEELVPFFSMILVRIWRTF